MVATILSWMAAVAFVLVGVVVIGVVLLANMMRPVPGPLDSGDKAFIGAGLVAVAIGGVFIFLLVKGY